MIFSIIHTQTHHLILVSRHPNPRLTLLHVDIIAKLNISSYIHIPYRNTFSLPWQLWLWFLWPYSTIAQNHMQQTITAN